MTNKVYDYITQEIIKHLEAGEVPWHKSWSSGSAPVNGINGKAYQGINPFLLVCKGYQNPIWFTFNQVKTLGGHVIKGEKSSMVIFWKLYDKKGADDDGDKIPILRYYRVFNFQQCEDLPDMFKMIEQENEFNPIEAAVKIVGGFNGAPTITHDEQRAYYQPDADIVNMPRPESFDNEQEYYNTLFHELTHSTGHPDRLNRKLSGLAGSRESYSKEELIAEMGASFLSSEARILTAPVLENASAYIQGWLKALKNDSKLVIQAAGKAQASTNYIRGV